MKTLNNIIVWVSFMFIISSAYSQQYWIAQQIPTTKRMNKVCFVDSLYGWAAGDSGSVVHTTNGGINWSNQTSGVPSAIGDLFFLNRNYGWAISNDFTFQGTFVLSTSNGGSTWQSVRYPDSTLLMYTIVFSDSISGLIGGTNGMIARTTNGGLNWLRCDLDINQCARFPILRFKFQSPTSVWAVGGIIDVAGVVWHSTDGGLSWRDSCVAGEPLHDMIFLPNNRLITSGGDFEYGASVYETTNSGINWSFNPLGIFGVGMTLAQRTANEIWIPCGSSGKFAVSTDSARNWFTLLPPDSVIVLDAQFTSPFSGWAVGCKGYTDCLGTILKYNTSIIGVTSNEGSVPRIANLFQNYPNPFNPVTKIKYQINKASVVSIKIYDLLGQEILKIDIGGKKPGFYSVEFDGSNYPSGVYFYELNAVSGGSEFKESKKMLMIR